MPLIVRLLKPLLLCCLAGMTQTTIAANIPFTVESDGSYSYFLTGNTLSLSNSGDITLGGHDANNRGINLISYQNGQFQIGGFLDLNEINIGNYSSDFGDTLTISNTPTSSLTISTPGSLMLTEAFIGVFNGLDNTAINAFGLSFTGINLAAGEDPAPLPSAPLIISVLPPPDFTSYPIVNIDLAPPIFVGTIPTLINNPSPASSISGGSISGSVSGTFISYSGPHAGTTVFVHSSTNASPVPLPSTLALLISGLGLLGLTFRRRAA